MSPATRTAQTEIASGRTLWSTRVEVAAIFVLVALAFAIRVVPAYRVVFTPKGVILPTTDPWYHLRRSENLVANFPHSGSFDPYLGPPGARAIPAAPGLDVAIAGVALALGLGHPDDELVVRVAAWLPPVLGALAVLPAFLLARLLWGTTAALVAGVLVVTIPTGLFQRSILGHADHHVAEALLAACAVALLAGALEAPGPRRRLALAAAAGVALAAFQLTWDHAWSFVLLLCVWLGVQWVANTIGGHDAETPVRPFLLAAALAFLLVAPFVNGVTVTRTAAVVDLVAVALAAVLLTATRLGARFARPRLVALGIVLVGVAATAAAVVALTPDALRALLIGSRRIVPGGASSTIGEIGPLIDPAAPLRSLWLELYLVPLFALPGVLVLASEIVKRRRPGATLVLVTSLGLISAALLQRRFAYQIVVPVALLAGLAVSALLRRLGALDDGAGTLPRRRLAFVAALTVVLVVLAGPTAAASIALARVPTGPSRDWLASLSFLRRKTPEPFGDAKAYLARCPDEERALPAPAYTVLAWWDFGYWITTLAHRVPVANPTQSGAPVAARFFLAQDEATADGVVAGLGVRYVVVDEWLPMLERPGVPSHSGKMGALAAWAEVPKDRFFEAVHSTANGRTGSVALYYPDYFRSMVVRMATFSGVAVTPQEVLLATFEPGLARPRRLRSLERFVDYPSAAAALAGRDPAVTRLASVDPVRSCVPVEALGGYRQVQRSQISRDAGFSGPAVSVFERRPPG